MEFGSDVVLTVPVDRDIDYEEIDETPAYSGGAAVLSSAQYAAGPNDPDACLLEILDTYACSPVIHIRSTHRGISTF